MSTSPSNAWTDPGLQNGASLVRFLVRHLHFPVASPAFVGQFTQRYVQGVEHYIQKHQLPVVQFKKGEPKDEVARRMRIKNPVQDGVVFVGVAQEKAQAFKATKCQGGPAGQLKFQYCRQPVFVKHYYFYIDDPESGECFIKFCTYAPYPMKVYLNGHEWAKRQLQKGGIGFESLDNGFWRCEDPDRLQQLCDQLRPEQIQAFWDRWLQKLPFALDQSDFQAGYKPRLSIWQLEYALSQVLTGRCMGGSFSRR